MLQKQTIKVQPPKVMRYGTAGGHWDLCCAVPQTSCTIGNLSFHSFWSMWMRGPKTPLQKRLQVYQAICVSTMLYNCSSWAAPKTILNKLDACHRRHLRSILGIHWPHSTISNEALYKRCNTRPLSEMVAEARWNMLGHVLRMDRNAPAQRALQYAVEGAQMYSSRCGCHTTNLLDILKADMKQRNEPS